VILIPGERRQRECTSGPRAGQKEVKVQYDVVGTRAQLDFRTNESVLCYLHFPPPRWRRAPLPRRHREPRRGTFRNRLRLHFDGRKKGRTTPTT
jgi:hypothetical protein